MTGVIASRQRTAGGSGLIYCSRAPRTQGAAASRPPNTPQPAVWRQPLLVSPNPADSIWPTRSSSSPRSSSLETCEPEQRNGRQIPVAHASRNRGLFHHALLVTVFTCRAKNCFRETRKSPSYFLRLGSSNGLCGFEVAVRSQRGSRRCFISGDLPEAIRRAAASQSRATLSADA
jgi:hypothetical protein